MASKRLEVLCERSALRLAETADERLAAGDVPRSLVALGGAVGLAFLSEVASSFVESAQEALAVSPKKTPRRAIARGRSPRRHHRGV